MEQDTCRKVMDMLDNNEYVQLLGIKIEEISLGHCKGKMEVSGRIENPYGALHGGSLYSFADIIAGAAACTYGNPVVTVSGSMNFLLPAAGMEYIYQPSKPLTPTSRLSSSRHSQKRSHVALKTKTSPTLTMYSAGSATWIFSSLSSNLLKTR